VSATVFRRLLVPILLASAIFLAGCTSSEDRAKAHFERGSEFAAQGDPVKASLEFRNALRLAGDYPDALFALGLAQEQQGNYAEAVRSFLTVTEQVPEHVQARVRLSIILLAGGQVDEAAKYVEQAAALAADDPSVLVAQSAIALKRGDAEAAVKLAQSALAKQPGFVDALMVLASERLLKSDPAGAVGFLDQAPASNDTNVGLQMLRLTALDALDNQPAVEELFVKLVGLFPETNVFRDGLVSWYLERGRIDDAERVTRERVAANPADDEARLGLTSFLLAHRSPEIAAADLEAAIAERAAAKGDTYTLRLALSQLQLEAGKAAEAIALTQSVVDDTTDVEKRNRARMQLARILVAQKDATQAQAIVDTVLAEDARNVDALSVRASLHLLSGDVSSAIEDLLAALNEAPNDGSLHGLLAEAYDRDGSTLLAQEQYSKALDLSGNSAQVGLPVARFFLRNGKPDQALRALELVRSKAPQNREVLGLLAQIKLANRDWLGAQQIADTLRQLGESTDNVAADRIGAAALIGLDRAAEGVSLLQSTIGTGNSQQAVLPDLINAYVRSGKTEAARDYLQTILADKPDDVQALTLLGYVYSLEGQGDLVEATLKKAAAGDGLDGEVALAQYYLSTNNHAAAEETIKAGLATDKDSAVLQRMLAALYEQTERFDEAIAVYEALYEKDPSAVNLANDLASLISERRSDPASLDRAFEIAQRLRGSDVPQYLDTLGWIYYLRGEYDAALPLLRSAAVKLPNIPLIHYHLGMAYSALGQQDLARTSLQKALEMTPPLLATDLEKAKEALASLAAPGATAGAKKS
jgi:tetratricopeptide (TPR) repeat protein